MTTFDCQKVHISVTLLEGGETAEKRKSLVFSTYVYCWLGPAGDAVRAVARVGGEERAAGGAPAPPTVHLGEPVHVRRLPRLPGIRVTPD